MGGGGPDPPNPPPGSLDKDLEVRGCFKKQSGAAPENDSISPQIKLALYITVLFTSIDLNEFKPDLLFPLRTAVAQVITLYLLEMINVYFLFTTSICSLDKTF